MNTITKQHLMDAWVDAVCDEIKFKHQVEDKTRLEAGEYTLRTSNPLWGSYWTVRKLSMALSYSDGRAVEEAMDRFLSDYCKAIVATHITEDEEN